MHFIVKDRMCTRESYEAYPIRRIVSQYEKVSSHSQDLHGLADKESIDSRLRFQFNAINPKAAHQYVLLIKLVHRFNCSGAALPGFGAHPGSPLWTEAGADAGFWAGGRPCKRRCSGSTMRSTAMVRKSLS